MKLKKKFLNAWHKVEESKRRKFLQELGTILNYLFNGILLAIPFYIFLFLVFNSSIGTYFLLCIAISILLAFFEHYYIFLRKSWEDNYRK